MAHKRIHPTWMAFGATSSARALYERLGPTGISRHE